MERRYQVFLSSTYEDLKEERLEVMKALLELGCIPAGMEYFPAGDDEAWKYVTDLIDECDYYIVVVGGRHGTTDSDGMSFTEREYRYATEKGVPVAAFLHANPSSIPAGKSERDPKLEKRLRTFRELCRARLCKDWSTPHELGAVVSRSLTQLIRRHPRPGWVRSTGLASEEAARKILELHDVIEEQKARLHRLSPPAERSDLARESDPVKLQLRLTLQRKGSTWRDPDRHMRQVFEVGSTWDELFRFIAPAATDWVRETKIRSALCRGLKEKVEPRVGANHPDHVLTTCSVSMTMYNSIMVQFLALGFLEARHEQVASKDGTKEIKSWNLTPYGNRYMVQIMAQRRPEKEVAVPVSIDAP